MIKSKNAETLGALYIYIYIYIDALYNKKTCLLNVSTLKRVGFICNTKNKMETRKKVLLNMIKPKSRSPSFLRVN